MRLFDLESLKNDKTFVRLFDLESLKNDKTFGRLFDLDLPLDFVPQAVF